MISMPRPRLGATGKGTLRKRDGLVINVLDQCISRSPGFFRGFAHHDMQPDAERQRPPPFGCTLLSPGEFLADFGGALTPGEVDVAVFRRHILPGVGGTAKIQWRIGLLNWRKEQFAALHAKMAAVEIDFLSLHQRPPHGQVFRGCLVALAMIEPHAVTMHLDRIAAGDHIDKNPTVRQPIERRGHACGH